VGYHVYLQHGISVCWHIKTRLESGPVTADLTTTVVHSYKQLINDVKPVHSLIQSIDIRLEMSNKLHMSLTVNILFKWKIMSW